MQPNSPSFPVRPSRAGLPARTLAAAAATLLAVAGTAPALHAADAPAATVPVPQHAPGPATTATAPAAPAAPAVPEAAPLIPVPKGAERWVADRIFRADMGDLFLYPDRVEFEKAKPALKLAFLRVLPMDDDNVGGPNPFFGGWLYRIRNARPTLQGPHGPFSICPYEATPKWLVLRKFPDDYEVELVRGKMYVAFYAEDSVPAKGQLTEVPCIRYEVGPQVRNGRVVVIAAPPAKDSAAAAAAVRMLTGSHE